MIRKLFFVPILMLAPVSHGQQIPSDAPEPDAALTLGERAIPVSALVTPLPNSSAGALGADLMGPPVFDLQRDTIEQGQRTPILDNDSVELGYQARLLNDLGEPIVGPVRLTFRLYDNGGTLVDGPTSVAATADARGIVSTSFPVDTGEMTGEERLVGVSIDGGPELTPRITLRSVPYALRVDRVENDELTDNMVLGGSAEGRAGTLDILNLANGGIVADATWQAGSYPWLRLVNDSGVPVVGMFDNGPGLFGPTPGAVFRMGGEGGVYTDPGVYMYGDSGTGGGQIRAFNASDVSTAVITADEGDGGALLVLTDGSQTTVDIDGNAGGGGGGIILSNSAGVDTLFLDGDSSDHASITLRNSASESSIVLQASEGVAGSGAQILIRDGSSSTTIELDGNWGGSGEGRVRTSVVEITGGADLSEQFDVAGNAEPGMVVSLDPQNEGKLLVASRPYDRTVAGIISGANGIHTGMLMGQFDSLANGRYPVALTGRVYCLAVEDPENPISVGDLLTTSHVPGRCMKVSDYGKAQGAIVGKAMSKMKDGHVLVLVSLQ